MTQHEVLIDFPWAFEKIKSGQKTIERRMYDDKFRAIKIGDTILFVNLANGETVTCDVKGLCIFPNYTELMKVVDAEACGWNKEDEAVQDPDGFIERNYGQFGYTKGNIKKYGVEGIVIKLCS